MKIIFMVCVSLITLFANKLEVTVSIVPQKYFVEKIAQDKVNVNVMVLPGFSPATYEPKTSQMKSLAQSSVYFSIGVPFENVWLERFKSANKSLNIVDTSRGITKALMQEHHHEEEHEEAHEHDHEEHQHHEHDNEKKDEHDDHAHNGLDPHIWVDPLLVKQQAKTIYETLVALDKRHAAFYQANYENFLKELDALYLELKTILAPVKNKAFMVFHPSWGYFATRFNLEQIAVEVLGKEPKPNQLIALIEEAKEHNIKTVFVSPEFSQKSAKVIASSIGGKVVSITSLSLQWKENLIFAAHSIVDSHR